MKKQKRVISVTISLGVHFTLTDEESEIPADVMKRINQVLAYAPYHAGVIFACNKDPRIKSLRVTGLGRKVTKNF